MIKNAFYSFVLGAIAAFAFGQIEAKGATPTNVTAPFDFPPYTSSELPDSSYFSLNPFGTQYVYSTITSVTSSNPSVATGAASGTNNDIVTITPTGAGTTLVTVNFQQPSASYNFSTQKLTTTYTNAMAQWNVTVPPIAPATAVPLNVGQDLTIPIPGGTKNVSHWKILQDGVDVSSTWNVSNATTGYQVQTYQLGNATLAVMNNGTEYSYNITSSLWVPGNGQVELADVSTTQPEYQALIANRSTAESYAASIGLWNYGVRRVWPSAMRSGDLAAGSLSFTYNSTDNVMVLEDTFTGIPYLSSTTGSAYPTSAGSSGFAYDPAHGAIYGNPSGSPTLPYSAVMAITGPGGTLNISNNRGYLSAIRVPSTNLALIGVTGDDDAGYGTSYQGYAITYLQVGSLPSEAPPSGTITASKAQVQTKGTVNITWQLN